MPPRYAYWTIIAGGLPTAFRMAERDELLPTFRRIKQKHPDAEMKYFARGRLWRSPEEARAESARLRAEADARRGMGRPSRGRAWRPGGDHQDPRQKFKDAKKVRNQNRRQERFDRRYKAGASPPGGGAPTRRSTQSTRAPRTESPDRPRSDQPPRDRSRRGGTRPDRPQRRDRGDHGFGEKPSSAGHRPKNDRGPRTAKRPASGNRPWSGRPPRDRARRDGAPRERPREDDLKDRPFRGKSPGGDGRPASTGPGPRSGSQAGASSGSPKGSGARKPAAKRRTSGPGSRPPGKPGRGGSQRGPAKDRRRR